MTSSNFGLKIAKNESCRRKLKLNSNDAKCQANLENILHVKFFFINRRAEMHIQAGDMRTG